jgi:hypothetical protein
MQACPREDHWERYMTTIKQEDAKIHQYLLKASVVVVRPVWVVLDDSLDEAFTEMSLR